MKYYWHIHHEVLLEPSDDIGERIEYIKNNKPVEEIPIRLHLLKEVKGKLPEAYAEAYKAYDEAWKARAEASKARDEAYKACDEASKALDEAWKACDEACKAYDEASKDYYEAWKDRDEAWKARKLEIEALHELECPNCPWDGKTIFPNN